MRETDFRLSPEPVWNSGILPGKAADMVTWLGNAKWGRKEWVGKLYPPKTPQRKYLEAYTGFYNSIELNATHYKIHGPAAIAAWAAVPASRPFLFCPKMYQGVTHRGKLDGKTFLTGEFLRGVSAFGKHLGPVFIQFPENYGPGRSPELFAWLRQLPRHFRFFLEVRHPGWFSQPESWLSLLTLLKELAIGIVITDTAGRRDCCHMHLTVPATFIRFVGNSLDPTDFKRCDAWVKRIGQWQKNGLTELFFFMHMHDETFSPELSAYLATKLNKILHLPVQVPEVKPELAAKPGKPRGINERFAAELEAAMARRTGVPRLPNRPLRARAAAPAEESKAKKQSPAKLPAAKKKAAGSTAAGKVPPKKRATKQKSLQGNGLSGKKTAAKKVAVKKVAVKKVAAKKQAK